MLASHAGRHRLVSVLFDAGASGNESDGRQWTALHMAALQGAQKAIRPLLGVWADIGPAAAV
jgi:ankyrin repeat protein